MSKFKVGDKVKLYGGRTGVVVGVRGDIVDWKNDRNGEIFPAFEGNVHKREIEGKEEG